MLFWGWGSRGLGRLSKILSDGTFTYTLELTEAGLGLRLRNMAGKVGEQWVDQRIHAGNF